MALFHANSEYLRGTAFWTGYALRLKETYNNPLGAGPLAVMVSFTPVDGVNVSINGFPVFTNLAVPGFSLQGGDRYGFGARTGNFTELVEVDNVVINPL